jgi:hypothetical protein
MTTETDKRSPPPTTEELLAATLFEGDPAKRVAVLLRLFESSPVLPSLRGFLACAARKTDGGTYSLPNSVLIAMKGCGAAIVEPLLALYEDPSSESLRPVIAQALTCIDRRAASAVPILIDGLKRNRQQADLYLALLCLLGEDARAAVPIVKDKLKALESAYDSVFTFAPPSPSVFIPYIQTLGVIGPSAADAIPELVYAASMRPMPILENAAFVSSIERVNTAASTALFALGAAAAPAVPALIELLKGLVKKKQKSIQRQCEIIEVLGSIGPAAAAAVPIIDKHLSLPVVKVFAANALTKILAPVSDSVHAASDVSGEDARIESDSNEDSLPLDGDDQGLQADDLSHLFSVAVANVGRDRQAIDGCLMRAGPLKQQHLQEAINHYLDDNRERVQEYWEKKVVVDLIGDCLQKAGLAIRYKKATCYLSISTQTSEYPQGRFLIVPIGGKKPELTAVHLSRLPNPLLLTEITPQRLRSDLADDDDWRQTEEKRRRPRRGGPAD